MDQYKEKLKEIDLGFFHEFPMHCTKIEPGHQLEGYMDIDGRSLNVYGVAHGGVGFTFGDNLSGSLAYLDRPGVTVNAQVDYLYGILPGRIYGKASYLKKGKTLSTIAVHVSQNGQLCLHGTYTIKHLERPVIKEEEGQ
ncbi:MAG: PaaI family thioesterase [Tissierellia bacterium]|nr:PaaI family thioesterase [Tissierellia bacterium]